ncbi:AMP-binding protein [uncultured Sulfitobacter sp.]|uniref:AMP-binding protein n=1 Tax=uncultured Sulfitobacter sp. TaxID=191468 RepID=UPI002591BA35|nr:AMP-binding protein [uncultured Sulfitobacter sp.]
MSDGRLLRTHTSPVQIRIMEAQQPPLLTIAPGAAYGHARRWLPGRYGHVADRLSRELGASVVLLGSAHDRDAGHAIESSLTAADRVGQGPGVVNLIGRTDLSQLIGVIASCRAFISSDSGAMHLATPIASNPDGDLSDVAVLLYTTGTTGDPKGVMLTHANVRFGGNASATLRGINAGDVVYGVLPLTHVFGLCSVMTASCCAGAEIRLEARFSAEKLYTALTTGVNFLSAVPQMHALLMQYTKEQGLTQLNSETLRYVSSGAAPLDPTWKRKAEAFYGVAIQNGYGMTESTAGISATSNPLGSPDISVGPSLPGVETKIDDTVEGGSNGKGEVLTRGAHVMKGYYKNPEETAKVLGQDGWLRTGDLGTFDEHGHLHILGRSKELIIHGGFNVYPPEVEAAINDHPQVIQAAVVGRSTGNDEEVLAFVQIAEGDTLDPQVLKAFVKERLTGYKRPSQFIIGTALPAAPTGKILKHKLIETFKDQLA